LAGGPAGNGVGGGVGVGVGGDVGEGGTSVPVDGGESKGDWNGPSGVLEAVAVGLAVGEAVGVLLDRAGAVRPSGDGVPSSTATPQAESKAPNETAPATCRNRRRSNTTRFFDMPLL